MAKTKQDLLEKAFQEELGLYDENDPDRDEHAMQNLIASVMEMAVDKKVDLHSLITNAVDLFEERDNELPEGSVRKFLAACSRRSVY